MKQYLIMAFGCGLLCVSAMGQDKKPFKDETEKAGYSVGLNTGNSLSNNLKSMGITMTPEALAGFKEALIGISAEKLNYVQGVNAGLSLSNGLKRVEADISTDSILRGFTDALKGGPAVLSQDEIKDVLAKFQQELQAKAKEKQRIQNEKQAVIDKADAETNKKAGDAFLAENAKKPGVKVLPSGLQYKILTDGKGESPKATDTVTVNYKGTFIDGTEFDSTAKHGGQPTTLGVMNFVQGWQEALQMMKPGAKWQLFVPSELGYKDVRKPGNPPIPPGTTMVFEIELLKSETLPAPAGGPGQPLTSDIIKVPSAEDLKKGSNIVTLKPEDVEREKALEQQKNKGKP